MTPAPSPVDCVGSWSNWGACTAVTVNGLNSQVEQRTRSYSVSTNAANGGSGCETFNGAVETQTCVDCVGAWSGWGACDNMTNQQSRSYSVSVQAANGGDACPVGQGTSETQTCSDSGVESSSIGSAVDCQFTWTPWSDCNSQTGLRSRTVSGIQVQATNGEFHLLSIYPIFHKTHLTTEMYERLDRLREVIDTGSKCDLWTELFHKSGKY